MKTKPPRPGWRYVVIRKTKRVAGKMHHWYDIHELFNIDGKESWTNEPVYHGCGDLSETRWALAMMLADSYREPVRIIKGNKLIKRTKNDIKEGLI